MVSIPKLLLARLAKSAAALLPLLSWMAMPAPCALKGAERPDKVGVPFISERREIVDRETGRKLVQLTSGETFDMPMYYFDPTYAADGETIVFYRYWPKTGEIQLYQVHSKSGKTTRLTDAKTRSPLWRPYLQAAGFGVRDLMSAVNPVTNEAIYFDSNDIRAVHLKTFADRLVARVPEGRAPSGLVGVSPDGRSFCYPHFDQKWNDAQQPPAKGPPDRWEPRDSRLVVVDLQTGAARDILRVNFWITHSNFIDNDRLIFCHNATDYAMCVVDRRLPYQYSVLRTDTETGHSNHYSISEKGTIMYEIVSEKKNSPVGAGFYDLSDRTRREYQLGITNLHGRIHIARDPLNRFCAFETGVEGGQTLIYFPRLEPGRLNPGVRLMGVDFSTFGVNQRSHFHPSLTPDRKHLLFTGGDKRNGTNHLFLIDVSDLKDTVIVAGKGA